MELARRCATQKLELATLRESLMEAARLRDSYCEEVQVTRCSFHRPVASPLTMREEKRLREFGGMGGSERGREKRDEKETAAIRRH